MTIQQKKAILSLFIVCTIMLLPMLALADVDDTPGNPDADVPLDGGLSLLVAAGVGFGAKKLKTRRALASSNKN